MPTPVRTETTSIPAPYRVVGAIPARYASSRLPGKALRPLAGRPLIEHVYRRVRGAQELDRIVVLTDDQRIVEAVHRFGGEVELTPGECASGTDRVAHAASAWDASAVVNIQGDEPLIEPAAIDLLARHLRDRPRDAVVTLAAPAEPNDRDNPDVVKVVVTRDGRALYFSRAAIPYQRRGGSADTLRHVGIYGYQRDALLRLAELAPSRLEATESLEQLRALENGMDIRVLLVSSAWPGVDTMADLEKVEAILKRVEPSSARGRDG